MQYTVEIIETLSRKITLEASTQEEAISSVEELYRAGEVVLCADDFNDVEIVAVDR